MTSMLYGFDSVRIINLLDRTDRRREMTAQLARVGATGDPRVSFFAAKRPSDAGPFPSIGARGCFESHLTILQEALRDGVERLLILEDDFDFSRDIERRGPPIMAILSASQWDMFYGASVLHGVDNDALKTDENDLAEIPAGIAVETASCVGFSRAALAGLEPFLIAMLGRPAGSPDYGPMHVDGAYSVFRQLHPAFRTLAARPAIGAQRASRSDISPSGHVLDRFALTRPLANILRRMRFQQ